MLRHGRLLRLSSTISDRQLDQESRVSRSDPMCKTKKSTDVVEPQNTNSKPRKSFRSSASSSIPDPSSNNFTSNNLNTNTTGSSYNNYSSKSSASSRASLTSVKASLPENPHIYQFSEIRAATNNFVAKRFSSSSSSAAWRCSVRDRDVVVFQRKVRRPIELPELRDRLLTIGRSHHSSLIKLLGASLSGNYIYLVYEFVDGANLGDCLRNPRNPGFTVLSSWLSRMQVATDIAHGLEYIHHCTGLSSSFVHNHIKSSSIIVTEESLNAKICHFGTAELCGELSDNKNSDSGNVKRSKELKFEGTRGYMAPEFQSTGMATQKGDVYAFGVVLLELLSGEEALKYKFDDEESGGGYRRVSVIDTAREAVREGGVGQVRRWVDRRLRDSYPVEVAEKMVRLGLECVEEDPDNRPDMGRVAVSVSKSYMESQKWAERIGLPTDFSVSMAPR